MALTAYCDGTIFGVRTGTSPRVLALHGWGRDHKDWDGPLDGVSALRLDLPGFGVSPPPAEAMGSAGYARALRPTLDELEAPVVVVGHSFGARVALHLAVLEPDRVGALVVSGVPFRRPGGGARTPAAFRVLKALHRAHVVGEARMEAARRRYGSEDYRRAEGVMRAVLVKTVGESYDDVVAQISCPVELVWGTADMAAPVEGARAAAAALKDGRLTEIDGGDHFACLRHPDVLRAAVARAVAAAGPPNRVAT